MTAPEPRWSRRRWLRFAAVSAGTATLSGVAANQMTASSSRFPVSDHCDGRRFFNPRGTFHRSFRRLLRWKLANSATKWPERIEITPQLPAPTPTDGRLVATWVNHATFLLQTRHGTLLTDPVWSERAGPAGFGPRRAHAPGIAFDHLPKIDAVLLSHDHYDHCDVATLRRLAVRDTPTIIAPLGHRALLRDTGFPDEKIIELDWWQSHSLPLTTSFAHAPTNTSVAVPAISATAATAAPSALTITLTPAQHWSNRASGSANGRLWGGFYLRTPETSAWFAGDTAYDPQFFPEIRHRLGAPQLAMIPIGAYAPRWFMAPVHCDPTEAVQIHSEVGARLSLGMHWGTFQLTDEGRDAPPAALAAALQARALPPEEFRVLAPGHHVIV